MINKGEQPRPQQKDSRTKPNRRTTTWQTNRYQPCQPAHRDQPTDRRTDKTNTSPGRNPIEVGQTATILFERFFHRKNSSSSFVSINLRARLKLETKDTKTTKTRTPKTHSNASSAFALNKRWWCSVCVCSWERLRVALWLSLWHNPPVHGDSRVRLFSVQANMNRASQDNWSNSNTVQC